MCNNIVRLTHVLATNKKRVLALGLAFFAGVVVTLLFHSGYVLYVVLAACFAYFCHLWWKAVQAVRKLFK